MVNTKMVRRSMALGLEDLGLCWRENVLITSSPQEGARQAEELLMAMEYSTQGTRLLPEQVWDGA